MTAEHEQHRVPTATRSPVLTGGSHHGRTWRDAMRPEVEAAWHALDRAQMVLYREYADTGDEQIRQLKGNFERVTDALIDLVIDELFPETELLPGR